MANMHLVTGFAGYEHVTSADQGLINSYIFGDLEVVMERGNMFEASIISNNIIRVKDGDLLMQGRFARLNDDNYVDLTIENGTQGYFRNDLIVARYQKDVVTAVETVDLVVIKGENAESDPADPAHVKGDIKFGKDFQNDIPLWRVSLDGLSVTGLTCLYSTFASTLSDLIAHADTHAIGGSDPLTLEMLGAAASEHEHTADKVFITHELADKIGSTMEVENALSVLRNTLDATLSPNSYAWKASIPESYGPSIAENTTAVDLTGVWDDSIGAYRTQIAYSDSITVNGGVITLVNPQIADLTSADAWAWLPVKNKYWTRGSASGNVGNFYYGYTSLEDKGEYSINYQGTYYKWIATTNLVEIVTIPEHVEGKISTNINEYPHSGTQDGLTYTFFGNFVETILAQGARIQVGTYVGTGTYGSANKSSLTFNFVPKFILAKLENGTGTGANEAVWVNGSKFNTSGGNNSQSLSGKTFTWYNTTNATNQLNISGKTYHWVAIG